MLSLTKLIEKNYMAMQLDYELYLRDMKDVMAEPLSFNEFLDVYKEYAQEIETL